MTRSIARETLHQKTDRAAIQVGAISSESRATRKPRNPQRKMPEVFLRVLRVPAPNVAPASIAVRFRTIRRALVARAGLVEVAGSLTRPSLREPRISR